MAYPSNYHQGQYTGRPRGTYHSKHGSHKRAHGSSSDYPNGYYPIVRYQNNKYRDNYQQVIPYRGKIYSDSSYNTSSYYGNAYYNNSSSGNPYYGNGYYGDSYGRGSYYGSAYPSSPAKPYRENSYYNNHTPSYSYSESYYPSSSVYSSSGTGMAGGSLTLGIIAVVGAFLHFFFMITPVICFILLIAALICSVVGVVLGSSGKKTLRRHHRPTGTATAGLVLSIIGVSFSSLFLLTYSLCVVGFVAALGSDVPYIFY